MVFMYNDTYVLEYLRGARDPDSQVVRKKRKKRANKLNNDGWVDGTKLQSGVFFFFLFSFFLDQKLF